MKAIYRTVQAYSPVKVKQGSPEWKALRLRHVTASNTPAIRGISPYKTALQYFEEISSGIEKNTGNEALFRMGHAVEAQARVHLREKLGIELEPMVVISNRVPELLASLDGFNPKENVIFESKYVGADIMEGILENNLPAHHVCQIQAQLLATGADKCFYFAQSSKGDAVLVDVLADPDFGDGLAKDIVRFMKDVREGKAPDPGERDFQEVDDPDFKLLMDLKTKVDLSTKQLEDMKDRLAKTYEGVPRLRSNGVTMIRSTRRGNIQYAKIDALKGMDLEKYRSASSEVVTFRIEKAGKK